MVDLGLDTDYHNHQLEFPTVSICPLDPFDGEKVNETAYRTLAVYEDNYGEYVPLLEMLPRLSYDTVDIAYEVINSTKAAFDNEPKTSLRKLAFKVAMKCEDLFHSCLYRGEEISCCDYFSPIYSERGFCYSFNARFISADEEE